MPVEILMPELGESVHEGTVSRWLKKVGEYVKEDEPVVEIMTDKVNTELGAPTAGILTEILIPEGGTVEVFKAMGMIEASGNATVTSEAPKAQATPEAAAVSVSDLSSEAHHETQAQSVPSEGDKHWFTPVVRSIAKAEGMSDADLSKLTGSGEGGRVTKKDLELYLKSRAASTVQPQKAETKIEVKPVVASVAGVGQTLTPLVGMRKMIADAMVRSSQVPTVSTVTQCDVTAMVTFREANKENFQAQHGVKLTYTPFFIKALAESLKEYPLINSSFTPDNQILISEGIHIGIAVALGAKGDEGLIVPIIRDCGTKNLIEISKSLEGVAKAARSNSLKPADVQGGTFTLTNPGTYGAMFGTPMINAPQAAILGVYSITKMPVVINDMIAIRSIMHLVLTYDHRIIDGLLAGKFLASVRDRLQNFDFFK